MKTVHADWRNQRKRTSAASAGPNPIHHKCYQRLHWTVCGPNLLFLSLLIGHMLEKGKNHRISNLQQVLEIIQSYLLPSDQICQVHAFLEFTLSLPRAGCASLGNSNSQNSLLKLKQEHIHWLNKNVSNANNMTHSSCFCIKMNKLGHPSPYAKKSQKYF